MNTLGLIGGMSWESTAEYYRLINQAVRERRGPLRSAPLLLHSLDFGPIAQAQHEGRWSDAAIALVDSARRLQAAGAQALVLCTNTMHKLADEIAAATPLPLLHIATPVGEAAKAQGFKRLGLLATAFTMTQPFLRHKLATEHALEVLTPAIPLHAELHRIIYEELCRGVIRDESRLMYQVAIEELKARGCEAVVLGCTEISLLVKTSDSVLPLLDTTAVHVAMAADFVMEANGR